MKQFYILVLFFTVSLMSFGQATDLFFSEYVEGSGQNKAIEIYNGTGAAVDLSAYTIEQSHDGEGFTTSGAEYTLQLSGTLADGDVYILYATGSEEAIVNVGDLTLPYGTEAGQSKVPYFNGNDAMGLFKNGTLIDVIGNPDVDTKWTVAGVANATDSHTLVRKFSVTEGNTTVWNAEGGAGSAGTNADDSEWAVFDIDELSFLGYHGESSENDILSFEHANLTSDAVIDATAHTVTAEVGFGTDITALEPTITVSYGAQVSPTGAQDFTNPVTYHVEAENGDLQDWVATVTVAEVSSDADITAFVLEEQTAAATINTTDTTITVEVAYGTDVTSLKPEITISYGATITPDTAIARDFTDPVVYTVTAEDTETTKDWTVTITEQEIPLVSIYEIQSILQDGSDASAYEGETVFVTGIVTGIVPNAGFYIQDSASAWNGIYVYTFGDINVERGDSVKFSGEVFEYFGLTELKWIENFQIITSDNNLPDPILLNPSNIKEEYEGILTRVENVVCVDTNFDFHRNSLYLQAGDLDTLMVHVQMDTSFYAKLNSTYNFTGIVNYDWSNFKIEPRDSFDIELLTIVNNPPSIVNIAFYPEVPVTGQNVEIMADIIDDVEVVEKHFYYGFESDAIDTEVELEAIGFAGTRFKGIVPAQDEAVQIFFKFVATDVEFTTEYIDSIDVTVGIETVEFQNVEIYPNPATQNITISFSGDVERIDIYNILGKQVIQNANIYSDVVNVNVSNFENGVYFVNIISKDGDIITRRFIKE